MKSLETMNIWFGFGATVASCLYSRHADIGHGLLHLGFRVTGQAFERYVSPEGIGLYFGFQRNILTFLTLCCQCNCYMLYTSQSWKML